MDITAERIFRRDDGSRVKVMVRFKSHTYTGAEYVSEVLTCKKGKRTWEEVFDGGDYSYRCLSLKDRQKSREESMLKAASVAEIIAVSNDLYNKLKPIKVVGN